MAIVKCPECGHQVSEMAPTCPSCGVQIAGKITRCTECGEVYFSAQAMCPACHCPTTSPAPVQPQETVRPVKQKEAGSDEDKQPKKKSYTALIASFIFALVVCGVCYYFYNNANMNKEREDYEYAMQSTDPMVLQSYLDRYKDADPVHRDSIQSHLAMLQKIDEDWTNAVVSGSRLAIEEYIKAHPDSPHKAEALNKLDSIDFVSAEKENTLESFKKYLEQHPDGKYADPAKDAIKKINDKTVRPEEEVLAKSAFRMFFLAINTKSEESLLASVADPMVSFLSKPNATKEDVALYLREKAYRNASRLMWKINEDHKITKTPVDDENYTYDVEFTASLEKTIPAALGGLINSQVTENYRINGTVDSNGKITVLKMMKLAD